MTTDANDFSADPALQAQVLLARERSLNWFAQLQAPGQPPGVMRISAVHDAQRWPGVLLPGTYNAVMGLDLLGGLGHLSVAQRQALADWLLAHRRADGVFRVPGMRDDEVFKKPDPVETWNYIDFHVSNYTLGAIEALTPERVPQLHFAEKYLEPVLLKAWLAERDLRDPWLEGNNIVNLGSFLLLLARHSAQHRGAVEQALQVMYAWHDRLQEPSTGFWGVGQLSDPTRLLHAMAGSMHNYHLWYHGQRPLPFHDKAVDYCLSQPPERVSACIDADLVDVLVHAHRLIGHRRADTESWLRALLPQLLAFQNPDGGFADVPDGPGVAPRRQDGWVKGYEEPQGLSNTFSTWFRWIAIAMICDCLWPRWQPFAGGWRFREMVGIGYLARKAYGPS
jgi:hypothetical protein